MKAFITLVSLLISINSFADIRVFEGVYEVRSGTGHGCFNMEVRYDEEKKALLFDDGYYSFFNINKGKQPWEALAVMRRQGTQETKFNGVDTLSYVVKESVFFTPEKMTIIIKKNLLTIKNKNAPNDCVLERVSSLNE